MLDFSRISFIADYSRSRPLTRAPRMPILAAKHQTMNGPLECKLRILFPLFSRKMSSRELRGASCIASRFSLSFMRSLKLLDTSNLQLLSQTCLQNKLFINNHLILF